MRSILYVTILLSMIGFTACSKNNGSSPTNIVDSVTFKFTAGGTAYDWSYVYNRALDSITRSSPQIYFTPYVAPLPAGGQYYGLELLAAGQVAGNGTSNLSSLLIQLNVNPNDTVLRTGENGYVVNSGNSGGHQLSPAGELTLSGPSWGYLISDTLEITSIVNGFASGTFKAMFYNNYPSPTSQVYISGGVFKNVPVNPKY